MRVCYPSTRMMQRAMLSVAAVIAAVSVLAADRPLSAQRGQRLELERAYPEPFGYVGGLRPMPDGRVMVADPLGQVLVVIDMARATADTLGRVGSGPQEYRQPDAVFRLPGDSTLLTDLGNGRLTVVGPDGTFGETMPIPQTTAGGALAIVLPRFVDARGRIYYQPESFTAGGPADSAVIARLDRAAGTIDTLGVVILAETRQSRVGRAVMLSRGPLRGRDDWAVAMDGRVAVVRFADYSVQWILPHGGALRGPAQDYARVPVGRAEKQQWIDAASLGEINVRIFMSAAGERTTGLSRGGGGRPQRDIDSHDWPDVLPPFRPGRSVVTPAGDLWVERYVSAGSRPVIDVFDERGRRSGEITLPLDRRVGGFGDGSVYLVRTDRDGLQWVERHRMVPQMGGRR